MENELTRILRRHSRSLATELAAQLASRSTSRHRKVDPAVLSVRCRMLMEALIRSTHMGSEQLGEFVGTITERRLAEGIDLEDLQRALRTLEVIAWRAVANESSLDSLRANLTALNTAMGYARDELARASHAHAPAAAS